MYGNGQVLTILLMQRMKEEIRGEEKSDFASMT